MKRILLAIALLVAGGTGYFGMNAAAHRARLRLNADQSELNTESQRLTELEAEKVALASKIEGLQFDLRRHGPASDSDLAGMLPTNELAHLSPAALEKLRTGLGLSWHSSADWVLMSKTALATVKMNALKGNLLTDAACGILAITPEERQRLNNAFAWTQEQFAGWATTGLQHEGPDGARLARFTIPPNFELAAGLSNRLASTVLETLGRERTELLQHYAGDWNKMDVGGFATMTNRLTVSRQANTDGTSRLLYEFLVEGSPNQGRRGESGQIDPGSRYFPPAFKSVFPGGWREVAERGGFELPKDFLDGSRQR